VDPGVQTLEIKLQILLVVLHLHPIGPWTGRASLPPFVGYSNATLFADVLRRCGDNLTRENLMAVSTHLQGVHLPALLPGITGQYDYNPIKEMRLQRFDGERWVLLPAIFDE
jgi:hypothetical protein